VQSSPLHEIPAIGYLSEVPPTHRAFLAGFGKFIRTSDGQLLITEGEPQDSLYLILSGTLHVTTNADNRALLIASLSKGGTIGEINLFDPVAASANVISRGECLIWGITRSELEIFFNADPLAGISVMKGLLKQTSSRIRRMNEKLMTYENGAFLKFWTTNES
jgi:CRP/FNR family transcriptional regulator, cyclic AMP receptor protein